MPIKVKIMFWKPQIKADIEEVEFVKNVKKTPSFKH